MLRLRREAREALVERPTFEQIEREARTHRLRILPEKQRRSQQGILLNDVDFDDFDLNSYDRKNILTDYNDNPNKGTQADMFESRNSTEKSDSIRTEEKPTQSEELESEPIQEHEPERQREQPERERGKWIMTKV